MNETVNLHKLLWPAPLAILGAGIVNLIWYYIAGALFPESVAAAMPVVNAMSALISTIAYWVIGLILFMLVARFSKKPITHFTYLAITALVVSFVLPFLAANGTLPEGATLDLTMILILIVMHVIAAAVALPLILKWVRQ
ncbi:MAG TPA: DUF6069 family protein [Anaerolineales bacterium]|nr:DUF6069 family protein [Anaerolineales bacterium]